MANCPVCENPLKECLGHTVGEATKILVRQRERLKSRVRELELEVERLNKENDKLEEDNADLRACY